MKKNNNQISRFWKFINSNIVIFIFGLLAAFFLNSKINTVEQSVNKEIASQQKVVVEVQQDIESIQKTITSFLENGKKEIFKYGDNERMGFFRLTTDRILVYFELEKIPIKQTIQIQHHIYAQPPNSFSNHKNIIWFNWKDSLSKIKEKGFYVSYIPSMEKNQKLYDLKFIEGTVTIDNVKYPIINERTLTPLPIDE